MHFSEIFNEHRFHIKSGLSSLWFRRDHCTNTCHSSLSVIASLLLWAWNNYVHWLLGLLPSLEFYQYWGNVDNLINEPLSFGKNEREVESKHLANGIKHILSPHIICAQITQSICCRSAAQHTHFHHGLQNIFSPFVSAFILTQLG